MKPRYIVLLIYLSFYSICHGQFHPVTIKTDVNSDRVYSFTAYNSSPIPYYVIVYLVNAKNVDPSISLPYTGTIRPTTTIKLFTISPEDKSKSCSFRYSYRYLHGSPRAKHNSKVNYLIPLKNVGATKVSKVPNVSQTLGKEVADTWNCFSFIASPGDTVYSSRRGTVLEVKNNFEVTDKSPHFTVKRNSILMVHKDGTLSRYSLFQKDGIFVQPGDEVFAGEPIGTVGGTSNESVGEIWLMIYQHNPKRYRLNQSSQNISISGIDRLTDKHDPNKWIYIDPNFITTGGIVKLKENGIYEPVHTAEGKHQELSKREKKRLLKKKKINH